MNLRDLFTIKLLALLGLFFVGASAVSQAQWIEKTPYPGSGGLSWAAYAYHNGDIYVFGGQNNNQMLGSVNIMEDGGTTWRGGGTLPSNHVGAGAATIGNDIYLFGGLSSATNLNTATWKYNPSTGSFVQAVQLPRPMLRNVSGAVGNNIYVVSGLTVSGSNLAVVNEIQMYSSTENRWSSLGTAPYQAYDQAGGVIENKLFVVGGQSAQGGYFRTAFMGIVNGEQIQWFQIADFPHPITRAAFGNINGRPMIAGGVALAVDNQGNGSIMEDYAGSYIYDEGSNTWEPFYDLPVATYNVTQMPGDGARPWYIGGYLNNMAWEALEGEAAPLATVPTTSFRTVVVKDGGPTSVTIPIRNSGLAELTADVDITSGEAWATGSSISLDAKTAGSLTVTLDDSGPAVGRYAVEGTITTNDPNNASIDVTIDVWVVENITQIPNIVLLEEAAGTWCGPCGAIGVPAVEEFHRVLGSQAVVLSHHDKGGSRYDPYSTTDAETLNNLLNLNAYPTGAVNRVQYNGTTQVSAGDFLEKGQEILTSQPNMPVATAIETISLDRTSRNLTATLDLSTAWPIEWMSGREIRVTAFIAQDSMFYQQAGHPDGSIYHMDVTRHVYPNPRGQAIAVPGDAIVEGGAFITPGADMTAEIAFTIPTATTPTSSGPLTTVPIDLDKSKVVYVVHLGSGSSLGEVLGVATRDLDEITTSGPSLAFDLKSETSKTVGASTAAEFSVDITNSGTAPATITIFRANNNLPAGWTSELCTTQNGCSNSDQVTMNVGPDETSEFSVKINTGSAPNQTGSVRVVLQSGTMTQEYTFTASTSGSGVNYTAGAGDLTATEFSPNPARETAAFQINLPKAGVVAVDLYAVHGEYLGRAYTGEHASGTNNVLLDVSDLENGSYIAKISHRGSTIVRSIQVVR